jgi:hypothetical protein
VSTVARLTEPAAGVAGLRCSGIASGQAAAAGTGSGRNVRRLTPGTPEHRG